MILIIDEYNSISSVNVKEGYHYLGMTFIPTKNMAKIIEKKLNEKMYNVANFYG